MLGLLRGLVRGAVAWLVGFVLTLMAGVAGLYGTGGFSGTATAYLRAHAVPPALDVGLLVAVIAVAVGGARAGRMTRSGVAGRIRAAVESIRGTEHARLRAAAVAGAFVALGYAAAGLVVGLWVGRHAATALVGGLVYGLLVGVPTAVVAARY